MIKGCNEMKKTFESDLLYTTPAAGDTRDDENGFRFCSPASALPVGVNEGPRDSKPRTSHRRRVSPKNHPGKMDYKGK